MNQQHTDNPRISSICPNSLGLKAGFWSSGSRESIVFKPILGWVSIENYIAAGKAPFCAVVLNDSGELTFAAPQTMPNFVGIFEATHNEAQALEKYKLTSAERIGPPTALVGRAVE